MKRVFVSVCLTLIVNKASAQGSILGRVMGDSGAINGATVELLGVSTAVTDKHGAFRLNGVPDGDVMLRISKIGFQQRLSILERTARRDDVTVTLDRRPPELPTVNVSATAGSGLLADPTGFESRRADARSGSFITETDIDAKHITETEQLFHGRPAVMVDTGGIVVIKRGEISLRDVYLPHRDMKDANMCIGAQVLVDGVPMEQPFNINVISPPLIRGIEIYTGPATTPSVLRTPKTVCGTVAIWTKTK